MKKQLGCPSWCFKWLVDAEKGMCVMKKADARVHENPRACYDGNSVNGGVLGCC